MALKQIFEQEKKAQKPFWDAWKKEKNVFKQMFLLEMYPTFMLPMRCWVLCPYPTPVAIILSASPLIAMEHFPGYGEYWTVYYCVFFGPLLEMQVFCILWYWIPGGKLMLCDLFYGEKNIAVFFGNPGTQSRTFMVAIGAVVTVLGAKVADVWLTAKQTVWDAQANAEAAQANAKAAQAKAEAARANTEAKLANIANEMIDGKVQSYKKAGIEVTPERYREIKIQVERELRRYSE